MIHRLLLPLSLGILIADACYDRLHAYALVLLLGAVATGVATFLLRQRRAAWSFSLSLSLCILFAGGALLLADRNATEQTTWQPQPQTYLLCHIDYVRPTAGTFQVEGTVNKQRVHVSLQKDTLTPAPQIGDHLWLHTTLSTPTSSGNPLEFDYAAWLKRQGVSATGFCGLGKWQQAQSPDLPVPLHVRLLQWRDLLLTKLSLHVPRLSFAILSAMTLGDKSHLDKSTRATFSATGASHILALSGLHLSIIYCVVSFCLTGLVRGRLRLQRLLSVCLIPLIWTFVGLAGAPPSLVRAATMLTLLEVCHIFEHEHYSLNHLAIAALLILIASPQALFDVGFQLSFAAVAGIVGFLPLMQRQELQFFETESLFQAALRRSCDYARQLIYVSLAAQTTTCLLVGYYFHSFPLYGLLVNLIAVPLASLILPLTLLFYVMPFAESLIGCLVGWLTTLMVQALEWFARLPFAVLDWQPSLTTVAGGMAVLACIMWRLHLSRPHKGPLLAGSIATLATVASLLWGSSAHFQPGIWLYNQARHPAVDIMVSKQQHYVWTTDSVQAKAALTHVASKLWNAQEIAPPTYLTADTLTPQLRLSERVLQVGQRRIVCLQRADEFSRLQPPTQPPLAIDLLILQRGFQTPLSVITKFYQPTRIVVDATLKREQKSIVCRQADSLNLPCHDVATEGAFFYPLVQE